MTRVTGKQLFIRNPEISAVLAIGSVGIAMRLVKITQPYIDAWSWRQSDVAMIARNFYHNGFNVLQPQIDWAGAAPGFVGTEFPLVPFLAALIYQVVGVEDWVGRVISIVFFALSLPFLFLLVRRIYGARAALFAASFYTLAPLSVYSGRSFMPDMASLSLAIVGMHYFLDWIHDTRRRRSLLLAAVSLSMASLVKLPAMILGLPILYLVWQRFGWKFLRKPQLWLFGGFVLLPPTLWYGYAYRIATANPPFHLFGAGGVGIAGLDYYWTIFERTFIGLSGVTPIVSILMVVGLFLVKNSKGRWLFHWWIVAVLIFVLLAAPGNHRHPWYQLPVVPAAAALAGRGIDLLLTHVPSLSRQTGTRVTTLALLFLGVFVMSWFGNQARGHSWNAPALEAGTTVKETTPEGSLILAVSDGDPTTIYYAYRKGWHFYRWNIYSERAIEKLEQYRAQGADFLVIDKHYFFPDEFPALMNHLEVNYSYLAREDDYVIFDLRPLGNSNRQP